MSDTVVRVIGYGLRRLSIPRFACLALLAFRIGAIPVAAHASPSLPRVVWIRGDHVYVAVESGAAAEGDSARVDERGKPIAAGRVFRVIENEMAIVTIRSGSLARVKKLDRLRVRFERTRAARPPLLRLALPANGRDALLFRCGSMARTPRLPEGLQGYVLDPGDRGRGPLRLLPDPHVNPPASWPETLVVVYFPNATDEEIALERGDVDVAVFWPGELSRRMREDARWKDFPLGRRSRGVVAITGADLVPAGLDSLSARALDEELFRGDLEWTGLALSAPPGPSTGLRVDPSMPGASKIEAWLVRRFGSPKGFAGGLAYVDVPADSPARPAFQPLYRLRCPVVSGPAWRSVVIGMDPDVLADMPVCGDATSEGHR